MKKMCLYGIKLNFFFPANPLRLGIRLTFTKNERTPINLKNNVMEVTPVKGQLDIKVNTSFCEAR